MNEEQIKVWREEFDINLFNGASFRRESSEASFIRDSEAYRLKMDGYLAGRKKAQEEIKDKDDLIIILKMKLNGSKEKVKELEDRLAKKDEIIKELWKLRQLTHYCWEKEAEIIKKKIEELENE